MVLGYTVEFSDYTDKFKQWLDEPFAAVSKRGVTEIFFYHLQQQPLDRVLPKLLQQAFDRGWRTVVQASTPERVEALSTLLWTHDDEGFLPHGTTSDGLGEMQPIWLTDGDDAPNGATVRFFVDGASPAGVEGLSRAVIIFDGGDETAVQAARQSWTNFHSQGCEVTYWQQDESGRWQNRAARPA